MISNKKDNTKFCRILIGNRELQFSLKRSSRKTIGIKIDRNGQVMVASPFRTSESYINQLLQRKSTWIFQKLEQIHLKVSDAGKEKSFEEGETFQFLGKAYKLTLLQISSLFKLDIRLEGEYLIIRYAEYDKEKIKALVQTWYVGQFKFLIEQSINKYSKILGVYPQRITIRDQKTRWGSCSAKGNVNLNWRLIMSPPEIIDYVIVHELCHMRQMNHSAQFWQLVESIIPSYKAYRKWLKENGDTLGFD